MTRLDIISVHKCVSLDDPQTRITAANKLLEIAGSEERVKELDMATATLAAFLQQLLDSWLYTEAALLCWGPELFDPRPRSVQMIWRSLMKYNKNLFIGGASLGKSFCPIAWLCLRYVHDHQYTNIKIVSTTAGHARSNTWSTLTTFHKQSIIPLPGEISSNFIGADPINRQAGISIVAIPQGDDGKGRLQGFHPLPRPKPHPLFGPMSAVILFIDEGEEAPNGIWDGVDNMLANEDEMGSVKIASSTNPKKRESMFAQRVRPIGGWGAIDRERDEEWNSEAGWHVTRLDAAKSENVIQKKIVYHGLQTHTGYSNLVRKGTSDPSLDTFGRGWYPEQTAEYKVMSPYILNDAIGTYVFSRPPTPCASLDPALAEGGDQAMFTAGRYGLSTAFDKFLIDPETQEPKTIRTVFPKPRWVIQQEQQFPIKKQNSLLMAEEVKELCVRLGVKPEFFVQDMSGNGIGIYHALLINFGAILGVMWGAGSTDKKILEEDSLPANEQFPDIVTEMWMSAAQWIEFGYMKFSPLMQTQKLFAQFTARRYTFVSKTMRRVESKDAYKANTGGSSPDESDSSIQLPHLIRMRQATNAAMMPDRVKRDGDGRPVWNPDSIKSVVDRIEFMEETGT